MEDNSVLLTISGIAVVSAFAIVSLFYIRAVSAISQIVRKKNPAAWQLGLDDAFKRGDGDPRHPLLDWWILGIVLDIRKLDLHGADYRSHLRHARVSFVAIVLLFVLLILGLGWFTQGTVSVRA